MLQQNVVETFWTVSSEMKGREKKLVLYDSTREHLEILALTLDFADMISLLSLSSLLNDGSVYSVNCKGCLVCI